MRRVWFGVVLAGLVVASGPLVRVQVQEPPIPHEAGQSISPSFEGWYKNADGTYTMSFGYFNRNFKEEPDIPVGPNNRFTPGPEDRGQPTHFMPRRQFGTFGVVLPKDFANDKNNKLTWTVTAHGETIAIPGHLRPEWEIDALKESTSGNTPPVIKFSPSGPTGQGPLGVVASLNATTGAPATLVVYVTDDGVKKREAEAVRVPTTPLGVAWTKMRGVGNITFTPSNSPKIENGKATTTAVFTQPGEYWLRLHAWDDSGRYAGGFQCCWTNGIMKVNVAGTQTQQSR
jgi:hypothetical protein